MKKTLSLACIALLWALPMAATEYIYPMTDYNAPSFTTTDNRFEIKCAKANGITPPQAGATDKYGEKDMRYYAGNTLTISSLDKSEITTIVFGISRNGHAKLTKITPSTGAMDDEPERLAPNGYRKWTYTWHGSAESVTFTIGDSCIFGYECTENNKEAAGTLFFKVLTINAEGTSALSQTNQNNIELFCTNGTLTIDGLQADSDIEIFDLIGSLALRTTTQAGSADVSALKRGIYLVRLANSTHKIFIP